MNVDSLMTTEPESRQETTQHSSFGEASSSIQAAAVPPPHGLTPEALQALREEGAQVLVYSGSRRMLFHGSKALEGNSAMILPADTACSESAPIGAVVLGTAAAPPVECDHTDIFADVDPDYHMLIVQQGGRTMRFWRPIEDKVQTIKGTPEVIIYVHYAGSILLKVYIVQPGDACWEEHPYDFRHGRIDPVEKTVLCGGSVYCLLKLHSLIFKLADLSWHLVSCGSLRHRLHLYVPLEVEGKVVVVGRPQFFTSAPLMQGDRIPFFRMEISGDKFDWVEITDVELDGKIWFIDHLQSFCVKVAGSGQKMCWFACRGSGERASCCTPYALHCLNLTTRAHCRLTADSGICSQIAWVDLGCSSDPGLLDRGITGDDLLPGF